MAELKDFNTLEEARLYSEVVYSPIPSKIIEQEFAANGVSTILEANKANVTKVRLLPELPETTVGEVCTYLINSFKSDSDFWFSPDDRKGKINRAIFTQLNSRGLITTAFVNNLRSIAEQTVYPFGASTQHDFMKAKGTITDVSKTPNKGWLKITTTADCEKHNPQIYADVQGVKRRVAGFLGVEKAGDYVAQVPREFTVLYVDDAYGVIQ